MERGYAKPASECKKARDEEEMASHGRQELVSQAKTALAATA